MDGIRFGTETTRGGPRRTSIGCPHGLAVAVDGDAVGAAPRPSFYLRPIPDNAIWIGRAVDGLNSVRLNGASPLLRLHASSLQLNQDDDQRRQPESHKS